MRIRANSIFTSHADFRDALVVSFGRLHLRTEERRVWRALPFMESEMRSGFSNVTRSGEVQ